VRYENQAAWNLLEKLGPGPSPVSPWAADADAYVRNWASEFGIVRSESARSRFQETGPGELAGRVYATVTRRERLEVATAWIGWLFLLDDQLDEGMTGKDPALTRERLRPLADMATGSAGPTRRTPLLAALIDVRDRIMPHMPQGWRDTFTRNFLAYLSGCEWEARNRALGRVPTLDEFPGKRREAGAIFPSLDLLEFVSGTPLPDRIRNLPLLAEIRTACADVVCWSDDLLTVEKERTNGDVHNFAIVLESAIGCGQREAIDMVGRCIEARVSRFGEMRRRLLATDADGEPEKALATHITGLWHWMRGHLEWGLRTFRYNDQADPASYLEDLLE
jgi:terpene synthase-like protein